MVAVTETWLKQEIMNCELLSENNFKIHRKDRANRIGGGVMLAVKNNILSIRRKDLENDQTEMLACEILPKTKKKLLILVFYRPPNTDLNYMKDFKKTLKIVCKSNFDSILVCGDFNFPDIDWTTGVAVKNDSIHSFFAKTVKDNYLHQLVDFPTRLNNTLDLLLTNIPDKVSNIHGFQDVIDTDHTLVSFDLDLNIYKKPKIKRSIYNFKTGNWSVLKEILMNSPWNHIFVDNDVNASLSGWCNLFLSAVDDHIPKRFSHSVYDPPWIDKELLDLLKKKNVQRRKCKKSRNQKDIEKYKSLRGQSKILIVRKKKEYGNTLKDSVLQNPKRFWSYVKSSTKSHQSPNFLRNGQMYTTDSREKANLLNVFFHSVFNPSHIKPPHSISTPSQTSVDVLSEIKLSEDEVAAVLRNLDPNKAGGPDGIPGRILKELANEIASSLCKLFNQSLSLGVVPTKWKFANVTPVYKKDDPTLVCNYRPISLLCILSKVMERCVFNHCYHHLSPFLYHLQHGFLRERSTVTQLLEVYHNILNSVASGKEVDIIYLDLSKAFDKVSHNLLLLKLNNYGISGPLLSWFRNYLTDRHQRVVLDGVYSKWLPITSGVPQGSILGPLLFLVYVNDVPNYIRFQSTIALFADDTKLYKSIDFPGAKNDLQADLNNLHKWSLDWGMEFNKSKCQVLHVSKRKYSQTFPQYELDGHPLECLPQVKDLGVIVSSDLTWSKHIEAIVAKANKTLGLIKRLLKDTSDLKVRKILYCTLVRPILEYACNLWSPYTAN